MLTKHAEIRCRQRGIRSDVVTTLMSYGRRQYRHGAQVCFMDHSARRRPERALGQEAYARLADQLNRYIVVADDGQVITAAARAAEILESEKIGPIDKPESNSQRQHEIGRSFHDEE